MSHRHAPPPYHRVHAPVMNGAERLPVRHAAPRHHSNASAACDEPGALHLADAERVARLEQSQAPTSVASSGSASILTAATAADGLMSSRAPPRRPWSTAAHDGWW